MLRPIFLALTLVATLLLGCATSEPATAPESPKKPEHSAAPESPEPNPRSFVVCKDPRPQICTREFRPVCAHTMDGGLEDRPSGCNACSDPNILGHRLGTCR